jgi:hypothetical protein
VDLISIVIVTAVVLGVLLLVLAVIAVVVLAPAVRRSLAEREASIPPDAAPDPDDDRAGQP